MKHVNSIKKEYAHLLNMIPEKFYQEFAATEEKNSEKKDNNPEEKKIHEIREQTDSWKNDLSPDKKELVEKFTQIERSEETKKNFLDQINEKIYLNNRFSEKGITGLKETESIKNMDEILKTAQPLREAVVIQKPTHDFQELLSTFDIDQPSTKEEKQQGAKQSLEHLSEGQAIKDLGYLTGSWITDATSSTLQTSHFVIEIPVDTRGISYGTADAPQVLLERNHSLYITERSTIKNEKGDPITKLIGTFHPNHPIDFQDNTLIADKWMIPFTAKLEEAPKAERDAILAYTGGKAYDFNEKLRNGQILKATEQQMANQIDTLIKRVEIPSPMVVYRRVDARQFGYHEEGAEVLRENNYALKTAIVTDIQKKIKENDTFHNLTYTSTSMSKDPDPTYDAKSRPILLKITLPAGSHAAFIGRESKFPNQQEILLPRDNTFKYGNISETTDTILGQKYKSLVIEVSMLDKK